MEVKDIKRLLDALAASEVREFSYETADYKLSVKRGAETVLTQVAPPEATARPASAPAAVGPAAPVDAAPPQDAAPEPPASHLDEVIAPIVGTFYAAAAPDAPDYVKVGDRVAAGAVLCIIEAMKLMNEIEAETAGTVREILVHNEDPVEYGQVLFRIEPD
jgi:acetyl-CoA carboxylase biotin carboxyl carrier protein